MFTHKQIQKIINKINEETLTQMEVADLAKKRKKQICLRNIKRDSGKKLPVNEIKSTRLYGKQDVNTYLNSKKDIK